MRVTALAWRAVAPAIGPVAVLLTVLGLLLWHADGAQAAPVLQFAEPPSCTPATVRPAAAAVISCTFRVTNTGNAPAMNLAAQPSAPDPGGGCTLASPIYLDRTVNGVLQPASGSRYNLGNLGAGQTVESVTRMATLTQGSGLKGTGIAVFSLTDATLPQISDDLCWNVDLAATDPPMRMSVTKTPINLGGCASFAASALGTGAPGRHRITPSLQELSSAPLAQSALAQAADPQGFGCWPPPPRPDYGGPLPVVPDDPTPGLVDFEIVVTNLSGPAMLNLSVLDVETGSGVFAQSEPPPTGSDTLGRPVWDVGMLDQGEEYRIVASYGPQQPDRCLMAHDIVVVSGTPTGGAPESYAAFPPFGQQVGNCEGGGESELCWHYPPEDTGYATMERCDQEVCWQPSPDGESYYPIYEGGCDREFCWFVPPIDQGYNALSPCDQEVCWLDYSGNGTYYSEVSCNQQFCEYTAPDASRSIRQSCSFPICWSQPPGGDWRVIYYGCNQQDRCWFVPPGEGYETLASCASDICWIDLFGESNLFDVPCSETFCEYTAPDGVTTYRSYCEDETCWSMPPEGGGWERVYNCQQDYWCWYTPPDAGPSIASPCAYPVCFTTPPVGGIPIFYFGGDAVEAGAAAIPVGCDEVTDYCWPVPEGDVAAFVTFPIPCSIVDTACWLTPPNDTAWWGVQCGFEVCWQTWPEDFPPPEDLGLPPDQMWPAQCGPGETGETGVPGTSVPLVVEEGLSTPAVLDPGTVGEIAPLPSASVTPATFDPGTVTEVDAEPSSDVIPVEVARPDVVDYDGDGCNNLHERSFSPLTGGLRDPDNVWDFFDTPGTGNVRDGAITIGDVGRVVRRFGRSGDPSIDPLSPPPPPPAYHTAFDRLPDGSGPNGSITVQDIAVSVGQFGHSCL